MGIFRRLSQALLARRDSVRAAEIDARIKEVGRTVVDCVGHRRALAVIVDELATKEARWEKRRARSANAGEEALAREADSVIVEVRTRRASVERLRSEALKEAIAARDELQRLRAERANLAPLKLRIAVTIDAESLGARGCSSLSRMRDAERAIQREEVRAEALAARAIAAAPASPAVEEDLEALRLAENERVRDERFRAFDDG